jgi:hypothetical protein
MYLNFFLYEFKFYNFIKSGLLLINDPTYVSLSRLLPVILFIYCAFKFYISFRSTKKLSEQVTTCSPNHHSLKPELPKQVATGFSSLIR